VLAALDEAVATRLVVEVPGPVPRSRFAHALVRATLYDELTAARRVALHRHVAEALESLHAGDLDDHLPALAHHWARASAPAADTARAVDYATRAGHRALAQLANDEAATYYRQGLELLDAAGAPRESGQRLELLIALGEAERRAGDAGHRTTLLDAARLARVRGDAPTLARAALANIRGMWGSGIGVVDRDRISTLEAALEAVGPEDSTTRARLLAALGDEVQYLRDRAERVALSDEAAAMARRLGNPATLADVLVLRQGTITGPDTVRERLEGTVEILALAEQLGDPVLACRTQIFRARAAREAAEFEEGARALDAAEELISELGQPTLQWIATANRAAGLAYAGRLDEAERCVAAAVELADSSGQQDRLPWMAFERFQLAFERGDPESAIEPLLAAVAGYPEVPSLRAMLARAYCEAGRLEEARSVYGAFAADRFSHPVDNLWLHSVAQCAGVCATLEDTDAAPRLEELLAPFADGMAVLSADIHGSVSHHLGMVTTVLRRFAAAEAHFRTAVAVHERTGGPGWVARTRLEWARMLVRRAGPGDVAQARDLLAQALATAVDLGLGGLERQARALLEAAGE
jgi:tetratricopeptide (TPR) repeat protein